MSNDKFKVKKGIKLETNSTASDEAGEIRFDGTDLKYYSGGAEKTILDNTDVTGTNTGDVTLAAVGSSPNANGASLSGQQLNLQPADATNPGVVTTDAQTFAGTKTFSSTIVGSINGNAATVTTNANLSGDVSSSGNTTTIGALKVTNAMLAGSIDVTTKLNGAVPIANGGTANASLAVTAGGTLYTDGTKVVNVGAGSSGQVLTSAGASAPTWATPAASPSSSYEISNLGLATSVGSSALTIELKQGDGSSDPSTGTAAVKVGMRSSTLTSGLYNQRSVTAALSLVISSGSTLGQTSAQAATIWIYLIDNAGALELAASGKLFGESGVVSTTAEGGAGAADSATVMYSTTARSNVPFRLIGKLENTQTTAGTWASAGTTLQTGMYGTLVPGGARTVQTFTSGTAATYTAPAGVRYIKVKMVGGGGGGAGSANATADGGSGTAGGDTTFGTLTAAGGGRGVGSAATGGTTTADIYGSPTVGSGWTDLGSAFGMRGGPGSSENQPGGNGGASRFGGNGTGGAVFVGGTASATNSGSGGGGAGAGGVGVGFAGAGGSSGAYIEAGASVTGGATFTYTVGAAGSAGSAGTGGSAGGAGAAGVIIVEEYYT